VCLARDVRDRYNKLEYLNACVILMISECGGSQSVYNRPNEATLINYGAVYILLCELCSSREEFETISTKLL